MEKKVLNLSRKNEGIFSFKPPLAGQKCSSQAILKIASYEFC